MNRGIFPETITKKKQSRDYSFKVIKVEKIGTTRYHSPKFYKQITKLFKI